MSAKICKRCGIEKDIDDFYKHKEMGDGHLNICKECKRLYSAWYNSTDRGKATDARRNKKKKRISYKKNRITKYRIENREKSKAHSAVNNAVKSGKLIKSKICEVCKKPNKYIHGHHEDYSNQLDVIWVCPKCHIKIEGRYKYSKKELDNEFYFLGG